ncbi:MAG TPA: response regulator transcription factor [Spirochaetota bacterium]|nr:response regulator transcription factor [Spirochaetota bacterium]HPS86322.1 response regulator transcription factor [Spirochaetota bacterium]
MNKIRIYIADDHAILRDGLKLILSRNDKFEIVGEAGDGKKVLEDVEKIKPDIVILDISMPVMTGLEVTRQIKKYYDNIKVIMLSRHDNEIHVKEALQNGANGYILKDYAADDLIRAITEVMNGNIYLSPNLVTSLITNNPCILNKKSFEIINIEENLLSCKEKQVLKLISEGNTSKSIALTLRISEQTVKGHRSSIMKKLDLHKSADLVKYAIKSGLIEM